MEIQVDDYIVKCHGCGNYYDENDIVYCDECGDPLCEDCAKTVYRQGFDEEFCVECYKEFSKFSAECGISPKKDDRYEQGRKKGFSTGIYFGILLTTLVVVVVLILA